MGCFCLDHQPARRIEEGDHLYSQVADPDPEVVLEVRGSWGSKESGYVDRPEEVGRPMRQLGRVPISPSPVDGTVADLLPVVPCRKVAGIVG